MKITVLKTIKATSSKEGTHSRDYLSGETYEIFDELAKVFISEKWGVEFQEKKIEEKAIEKSPENKAILSSPENKSFEASAGDDLADSPDNGFLGKAIKKMKNRGKK